MRAETYISTILLIVCCSGNPLMVAGSRMRMPKLPAAVEGFNCRNESIGFNFNLTRLSGYWYEAARVPNLQVLECLNVSVPAEIENNTLSLDLNFISTVNNDWQFTNESVKFPWDDSTQLGVFNLQYDKVMVTYKLMYTDYDNLALICGFGSISPVPLFKLFTRRREISQEMIDFVQSVAEENGVASQIAWDKQSPDECNASRAQAPLAILVGSITLLWGLSLGIRICT
ncbi:apolipoprotein D [Drosophila rhopaloa]|uniref:Apolipoprotein D n=1 Tax=Drosophila rhopaloa TaxID=1041015 RepID=A0A6P4F9Q6_DRORH|nr:apolipoprotein D [Drosophila rhopaloa]